jgi:hypothetical protein
MTLARWSKSAAASFATLLFAVAAWAQDPSSGSSGSGGTTTTTTSSSTTMWYGQWYIWVGIALFVIIVIALTNRGSKQS